jgi:flagellar hook-basal body complex protein FliE
MSVAAIESAGFLPSASVQALEARLSGPAGTDFAARLTSELGRINGQLLAADGQVADLALGKVQNLHEVMIALEEAKLSFQLLVQVRNRALEAYQEILRMQV